LEALEPLGFGVDQVGGVDAERLDRDRSADRPQRAACVECGLEVSAVERAPGVLQRGRERGCVQLRSGLACGLEQGCGPLVVREGLAVAGVEFRPRLLERVAGAGMGLWIVRKGGPGGLRSRDRVLSARMPRALPGTRPLASIHPTPPSPRPVGAAEAATRMTAGLVVRAVAVWRTG